MDWFLPCAPPLVPRSCKVGSHLNFMTGIQQDFLGDYGTKYSNFLSSMPVELEGYMRPGCTILTVFIAMPAIMWVKLLEHPASYLHDFVVAPGSLLSGKGSVLIYINDTKFLVAKDRTSVCKVKQEVRTPRIHYVQPMCFEAGQPMEFVACDRAKDVNHCTRHVDLTLFEKKVKHVEDILSEKLRHDSICFSKDGIPRLFLLAIKFGSYPSCYKIAPAVNRYITLLGASKHGQLHFVYKLELRDFRHGLLMAREEW